MAEKIIQKRLNVRSGGEVIHSTWLLPSNIERITGMAVVAGPGADQWSRMQTAGVWQQKFGELNLRQWRKADIFFQVAAGSCSDHRENYLPMNLNPPAALANPLIPAGKTNWFQPGIDPGLRQLEICYRDRILQSPPNNSGYFIDLIIRYDDR